MDYFFINRPQTWTFESALLYYVNKLDGNLQLAAQNMKNDLQVMISSELVEKKATDIMRGYHKNFDKLIKKIRGRNPSSSSTSVTTNNQIGHTNVVVGSVGTQNITANNNNSSSSSSRKRKQQHQSDSDDNEDEAEDDVNDDERRRNTEKLDYLVDGEQRITIQQHDNVV
ncbi:hypothetical protein BD408DRAFT_136592 [Parasitella parasitica]|nr:hypothetical protein BD408DRAFT_136592 [Parasitella parasitica]